MKKQQSGFMIYIVIVVVGLLIGGTYLYNKENVLEKVNEDIFVPTAELSTTTINNLVTNNTVIDTSTETKAKDVELESWVRPCVPFTDIANQIPEVNLSGRTGFISEKVEKFYEIRGETEGLVFYQMINCLPVDTLGTKETAGAITYTNFNRMFNYDDINGQVCNIHDIAVGIHSTVLYPKWDQPVQANMSLINKWNTFMKNLRIHEEGHVSIGVTYSKKYYDYLNNLSENKTCVSSIAVIDDKQDEINAQMIKANSEYDRSTRHGETQGANFNI